MALICRDMHWTYQQYRSQPKEFIDILQMMHKLDAEKDQEELQKQRAKAKQQQQQGRRR